MPPLPFLRPDLIRSRVWRVLLASVLLGAAGVGEVGAGSAPERPRLAVLTDIGGDPDDEQSLVRLMLYVNAFDVELLAATAAGTPGELAEPTTRPDLIHGIVEAYGELRPRLVARSGETGWPTATELAAVVCSGNPQRGRDHIGVGYDTAASRRLIERVDAGSATRLLHVSVWGGQTDLAQAFWRVRQDRGAAGWHEFAAKLRVFDINDQDGLADWLRGEFPGLHYLLSRAPAGRDKREGTYRGMYLTGDENLTSRAWVEAHLGPAGPLGARYPRETWTAPNPHGCIKEGDTPAWFFFLPAGGNDPADPAQPGWGGQYRQTADGWWTDLPAAEGFDPRTTVSRWRPAYQADFARRLAWCRAEDVP